MVPMLCVRTQWEDAPASRTAERFRLHSDAERGNDKKVGLIHVDAEFQSK